MKVLIVHHCDSIGGAGLSARLCAKMLMDKHNVTVCIPHKGSSIWKLFEGISNISLIELGKNIGLINAYSGGPRFYGISFIKGILDIFNSKKEVKKILANDYDLIILNSIALSWALKIIPPKTKKIIYIRETKGNNPFYRLQNKYINRYADGVVFISNYDQKSYMLDTNKQCVIHNSCLPEFASVKISRDICQEMFGISNNYFNVLFVGGTETIKGYEIIIKAFKRLEGKPIRLIIAGKCELKKKIVVSNVCYLGEIINTSNLYNSVDLLVFPSVFPHQARPAFEAGFFKLPVIISDFPQTREEIQNDVSGLLFKPGDDIDLADKIMKIYYEKKLKNRLGEQNYKHSIEFHSFETNKSKLLEFIDGFKEK